MEIKDHAFLVSGGSSGLGAACVRRLNAAGGRVVIADLSAETGQQLATELGASARFVRTDVTDAESVQAAVDVATATFGGLHGLVHCAGIIGGARVVGKEGPHDLELFKRIIDVNLVGTFNVVRLAAVAMMKNPPGADGERGVIVATASVAAYEGQIGQAAYSASKGGVAGLTLPVARELAKFGIRMVSIAPGVMGTPMIGAMADEAQKALESQVPFPARLGHPDEFAALAQHIIENRYLNGSVLRLDGAIRMAAK